MLGDRFAVATAKPVLSEDGLFPEERRYIMHAAAKRRAEFATVRVCARRALAELGVRPCPLVPAPDGAPCWPPGIVGSLSHANTLCAAAVSRHPDILAVGIDVEDDTLLDLEIEELTCSTAERDWLRRQDPDLRGRLGMLVFSAKEAVYKCQYAVTGAMFDFGEINLVINLRDGMFHVAQLSAAAADFPCAEIRGRFHVAAGHLLTTAVLERPTVPLTVDRG